ncbi:hypothetical protein II906_13410 [bacterium]|nr:hypothetical protein [bacterium]
MKKIILFLFAALLIQNICIAKDKLEFAFPNDGWHKVASPDGIEAKKCYVPYNQSSENYTEMLIFVEKKSVTNPAAIMQKQLGKDMLNYNDIIPEYVRASYDDAMATWCSRAKNTCAIHRTFFGKDGIIIATYINKMPHYSQNMFGQWSNILNGISLYNSEITSEIKKSIIEL